MSPLAFWCVIFDLTELRAFRAAISGALVLDSNDYAGAFEIKMNIGYLPR